MFVVSFIVVISMFAGADQLCRYDINRRLPNYPGAELIHQEKDLLRYRAAGTTSLIFHTNDNVEKVSEWYRALNLEQIDKGIFRGLADIQRRHEADPDGGTTIYYRTACGT